MSRIAKYKQLISKARASLEYWREVPMNEFAVELGNRMERLGVTRAELARRLGTSQAYVTKVLGGRVNFTIETMVKLAFALDGALHLHISDLDVTTRWGDDPTTTFQPEVIRKDVRADVRGSSASATEDSIVSFSF